MKLLRDKKKNVHEKLFMLSAILVAVSLPFSIKLNGIAIILLSINWITEGHWSSKLEMLKRNKIALLFLSMYGLHIIGLVHTQNISQGLSELEKKVAFVVFPVVFSTTKYLDQSKVSKILNSFVAACLLGAIICVVHGVYFYLIKGDPTYLFYHNLGAIINFDHAIYFSFYVCVSIFYLLIHLESRWRFSTRAIRAAYLSIITFFLIFLLLLSSKTLIVTFFLLLVFYVGSKVLEKKGAVIGTASVLLCLMLSAIMLFIVPNVKDRFQEVLVDEYNQVNPLLLDDYQDYHFTGGAIRLAIWKMTTELIVRDNAWLWGVGTGDSQDELTSIYVEKHVYAGDPSLGVKGFLHYNTHNQFMQFFLMFGVVGAALFIYTIGCLLKFGWLSSRYLLYIVILFLAFSITESTLHVQKGIVAFLFLVSLLTFDQPVRPKAPR